MTRIVYGSYDDRFYFEATGHAVSEELFDGCGCDGSDESAVCAAISMLVFTAVERLGEMDRNGDIARLVTEIEDGYACIDAQPRCGYAEAVGEVFSFLMTGFALLEENHPELISCE